MYVCMYVCIYKLNSVYSGSNNTLQIIKIEKKMLKLLTRNNSTSDDEQGSAWAKDIGQFLYYLDPGKRKTRRLFEKI